MRLLHLVSSMNPEHGELVEEVSRFCELCKPLGIDSEVVTQDNPSSNFLELYTCPVHALGVSLSSEEFYEHLRTWLADCRNSFDGFILHSGELLLNEEAWRALRVMGLPYVLRIHGILRQHFCQHFFHAWRQYLVPYWMVSGAKTVLFASEEERLIGQRRFWPLRFVGQTLPAGRLGFRSTADDAVERFQSKFPKLKNKRFILFPGQLMKRQGSDLALQAFCLLQDNGIDLVFTGEGPRKTSLEAQAEKFGRAKQVHFIGTLQGDIKWGAFLSSEVLFLPSLENCMDAAVIEALSCGLPALLSRKIGIWREVHTAGAGLIDQPGQKGALRMLRSWVSSSEKEKERMSANARQCFAEKFDIRAIVSQLVEITSDGKQQETLER